MPAELIVNCESCGVEIRARSRTRRYCDGCRHKRRHDAVLRYHEQHPEISAQYFESVPEGWDPPDDDELALMAQVRRDGFVGGVRARSWRSRKQPWRFGPELEAEYVLIDHLSKKKNGRPQVPAWFCRLPFDGPVDVIEPPKPKRKEPLAPSASPPASSRVVL